MARGGYFDYIQDSGGMGAQKLRSCLIQPRANAEELQALLDFQEKFDVIVRYLLGDEEVEVEDIIEELELGEEMAYVLRNEVDRARGSRGDLSFLINEMEEPEEPDMDELSESMLAAVGDFWTRYQLIQDIAQSIYNWESRLDKSNLSKRALEDLYRQLKRDFSHERGLIRAIYDNLIPRIERLLEGLEDSSPSE
ncbi:MAG: hypothetical protein KDK78_02205 [Chlamydiia bacterium]|nr:hypothetical protein [Chlamydiia bacterium]